MKLNDIVDELFDIATDIENHVLLYPRAPLVLAKKLPNPAGLLTAIAAPIKKGITNGTPPCKKELEKALDMLKEIAKTYKIKELKKPIADLKAYLDNLG